MASALTVVNEALVRIGVPPISSFSEHGAQALATSSLYSQVRETVMTDHPWSFALREAQLPKIMVPDADLRSTGWTHVYQLPTDHLRVLGLRSLRSFTLSGDQLYTDDDPARLVYIANVDEAGWPAHFRQLVVYEVAAALAVALTDSGQRAETYLREARTYRPRARAIDSQQTPPHVFNLMRVYLRPPSNPLASA
jgi:hypothetical protein